MQTAHFDNTMIKHSQFKSIVCGNDRQSNSWWQLWACILKFLCILYWQRSLLNQINFFISYIILITQFLQKLRSLLKNLSNTIWRKNFHCTKTECIFINIFVKSRCSKVHGWGSFPYLSLSRMHCNADEWDNGVYCLVIASLGSARLLSRSFASLCVWVHERWRSSFDCKSHKTWVRIICDSKSKK